MLLLGTPDTRNGEASGDAIPVGLDQIDHSVETRQNRTPSSHNIRSSRRSQLSAFGDDRTNTAPKRPTNGSHGTSQGFEAVPRGFSPHARSMHSTTHRKRSANSMSQTLQPPTQSRPSQHRPVPEVIKRQSDAQEVRHSRLQRVVRVHKGQEPVGEGLSVSGERRQLALATRCLRP